MVDFAIETVIETGGSFFYGIIGPLFGKINNYIKDKKHDKNNVQAFQSMNEDKEAMKKYLFELIEKDIASNSPKFENILSKYNPELSIKKIFNELNNKKSLVPENKLKPQYEKEINDKKDELEKIIKDRTNSFLIGNDYSKIYLLNKQIIYIIIYKLFKVGNIYNEDMELKYKIKFLLEDKIKNLFKDFINFISKEFGKYYENNLGNLNDLILKYKEERQKKINKQNEEDVKIIEEYFQYINDDFFSKENKNEIINKVFNLYKKEVIKKASSFIDNKINELLSSLLIQSL